MMLFPPEAKDFQLNTKFKVIRSSCVSSVSVTCMRRTCLVPMRIVFAKKNSERNAHHRNGKMKDLTQVT